MGHLLVGLLAALLWFGHGPDQGDAVARSAAGTGVDDGRGGHEVAAERSSDVPGPDGAHWIGDWALLDGNRLVTGDGALTVVCAPGGNGVVVEVVVEAPEAAAYRLRFEAEATAPWVAAGSPGRGGVIGLSDADEDRLLALLARHDALTVTLWAHPTDAAALTLRLTTAGFEMAFSWLGCGVSDTCPARSCGR